MPKPREDVVIQEPPMEELGKRHSCLKRTCLSGCGCFLFFIAAAVLLLNFATRQGEKTLAQVPAKVKEAVPLYDTPNVQTMTLLSAKNKNKGFELAVLAPKILLLPLVVSWPDQFLDAPVMGEKAYIENIKNFFKKPVGTASDTITLDWKNMHAEKDFIEEYYISELEKKQFVTEIIGRSASSTQIIFKKNSINGAVYINDQTPKKEGTDFVSVKINMSIND